MKKYKHAILTIATALVSHAAFALSPGSIAFTGFNSDGDDNLAFVALAPIPGGAEIYFTDNEWNGQAIGTGGAFVPGESEFKWTAPAEGVTAGTIVKFDNVSNSPTAISASSGAVGYTDSANTGISNGADIVFAFQGAPQAPTVFLASITNGTGVDAEIGNTGLTTGSTAIVLPSSTDGGRYKGERSGLTTFAAYLPGLGNVATNWDVTTGDGTTYLPFASDKFFTLSTQLILTEVNSNANPGDFWELTNVGTTAVGLDNFKWTDGARSVSGAVNIPTGTSIAAGESVIFTGVAAATFRSAWNILPSVKVITGGGAPGLGMNDGITLFNAAGNEVLFLSFGSGGFTRSSGSPSAGGHAGASAGGTASQSLIWDKNFGTTSLRYTFASVADAHGSFAGSTAADVGSPGVSGFTAGGGPAITLSLSVTPATFSESAADPAAVGTVTRTGSTAAALVVTLSCSDTTEATAPASVTISAGQASASFNVSAVNDTFPDGSKTATITASAPDASSPTFAMTVQDDGDVQDTSFLLTELQSNQSTGKPATAEDYWELTNISATAKNISGYSWHDSGRSGAAAAAYKLPPGTVIAPGESVIFTAMPAADFRAWWNLAAGTQVFQSVGAPGLGQADGISFFDDGQNELFFFSYVAGGFTREDGSPSTGTHAGPSAGGSADSQALVWVPGSGTASPRYTFATGTNLGTFSAASPATDLGSPGNQGVALPTVSIAGASINESDSGSSTMTLTVTRSDAATAFSVDYAVTGGTATSGTDYAPLASGTLSFTVSGPVALPVNLSITGDTTSEPDETVVVTLSNIVNTTGATIIATAAGTGTIVNDDVIAPLITTHPVSTTIATGGASTLTAAASGFPTPVFQWYLGSTGDTGTPVDGATSATFTTPALTASTSYWVRAINTGGTADSSSATVTVTAGATSVNLAGYVRVGRYGLPEPTRTALPPGTPAHNLLCQEASGVTYNWDTDTLFIACDGGKSITQVSKTGALIDTMTLALGSSPQGTDFYDIEGITYLGGGQFVVSEERDRQLVKFTYVAGTTLSRSGAQTVKIGTFVDNTGTEGLSYDPQTGGFICLKEVSPIGIFQTGVDFVAGTATNGSPSTVNSIDLFNPTLTGMTDLADVFALSNLPSMTGQPQAGNLMVLGQEDGRIINVDRSGNILSTLTITSDPGNPLNVAGQQHEGITMDRAGNIYIVNENGGGDIDHPQLWVYAPSALPNQAPTAVALDNAVNAILENTSTASPTKLGDIVVTDDGLGTNVLSLTGTDAGVFEITSSGLYLKAGTVLDYETKTSYSVTVDVDDATLGATPDATISFTLFVTDQAVETPPAPALIISEVAPWSSTNGIGILADWFEVTNISPNPVTITGWKVDDSSAAFGSALVLNGVTTIAPGESVIFMETSNLAATSAAFKNTWFGANPPAGLQIGSYSGSGIGLSTGGDAVNLYNAVGVLQSSVSFGTAPGAAPFATFDNTVGLNSTTISQLSAVGIHGAFAAVNDVNEIGSPGYSAPGNLVITEVAAWGSGNSPAAADWFEVTNTGARTVDMTGWKMDDSSESPAAALLLTGVSSIAPGESVIFMESATLGTTRAIFLNTWFGADVPAGLQVGAYSGSGAGLSTGGDAVNLYDSNNVRRANVSFGASSSSAPYKSFDNAAGINVGAITQLSVPGVNGAFVAETDAGEIGSPGTIAAAPGSFAAWLSENGHTSNGISTDTDSDGLPDLGEYFFNQSPNRGDFTGAMPQLVLNGADLEFRFSHLSGATDAVGILHASRDLTNWLPALPAIDYELISEVDNNGMTEVRYRLLSPGPAPVGPFSYLTPNTAHVSGGALKELTVINHGLVGTGRLSGESLDAFGETQGAASGLSITNWSYNSGSAQFSGTFNVLPDRGYNSGAIFSNYATRVHRVNFTFIPYLGAGPVAPGQIVPTYVDSTKFVYQDGATTKFTTGLNPTGTSSIFGQPVGTVTAANGPGGTQESLISFDAEAIHVFPDGSGFISDEYGTYLARFDATKKITKLIQLPAAAQPHTPVGVLNFDSINAPTNGRRNNQGLEGMAVSPDNTRLFALMQSALVQDTNGSQQQTRINTRLYVYDISGANLENPVLIGEHVVQLPRLDLNGNGSGLDGTAAQSELVALSNTQFLMLPRDGNGLGKGTTDPIVTKAVELVDITDATNVLGLYDVEAGQISPGGVLRSGITPAASIVVVNLLSSTDLAKFGLNANTASPDQFTINEKMEGMSLVPDLATPAADDFYLFVANDNDFQSSDVRMLDASGNIVSYGDGRFVHPVTGRTTNDAVFYVYRLTITSNQRKFYRLEVLSN